METNKAIGLLAILAGLVVLGITIGVGVNIDNTAGADDVFQGNTDLASQFKSLDIVNKDCKLEVFEYSYVPKIGDFQIGGSYSNFTIKTKGNDTIIENMLEKYDLDNDDTITCLEYFCASDERCIDPENPACEQCPKLQGRRFPQQCSSKDWVGTPENDNQDRMVKGGQGDKLSGRIAALSFYYNAFALGNDNSGKSIISYYTDDCSKATTIEMNNQKGVASFATLKSMYNVQEEEFINYCEWFAKHPIDADDVCKDLANQDDFPTKDATMVKPNRICQCINYHIAKNWDNQDCDGMNNNKCNSLARAFCTQTVYQNPSHINDVQQQWDLSDKFMTVTGGAGNRCQWMAYLKTTNKFGQCVDHTCSGLNNGECTIQNTGGRCVWYNKGDLGCRSKTAPFGIIPCPSHGCYTSPCNNPMANTRPGCKAQWTSPDPITGETRKAKYACVWCTKKVALNGGHCPKSWNPEKNRYENLGGCGGCTNAGDPKQIILDGYPKCPNNDCTGLYKTEAKCASIRACKAKKGSCVQLFNKNEKKPCYCSFTNPYCWMGKLEKGDKAINGKYMPF